MIFAVALAALCAAYTVFRGVRSPALITDLDHLLFGARELLAGRNPYLEIGPGKRFEWPFPLYYPAPTLLLLAPFTVLPLIVARTVFAALSGGALGYVITRSGWARVPLFLSAAFVTAIGRNQWSPLLLTACAVPVLGLLTAAKPNIGLATLAGQSSRRDFAVAVASAACLGLVSLAVRPTWPLEWLAVARTKTDALVPAAQWMVGGPLLLLAVLRWRRADARILLVLGATPQSPFVYDTLPLLAVARTRRQALLLALATDLAMFAQLALNATTSRDAAHVRVMAMVVVGCTYLPCLVLVLRRPNVSTRALGLDVESRGIGPVDGALWLLKTVAFAVFVFAILTLGA